MLEIPILVADVETVVRGIFYPHHLKNSKLRWEAFFPPPGRRDLSVMRQDYLGVDECSRRARTMADANKTYKGLASLGVRTVRDVGPDVVDSRAHFMGHADIMYAHARIAGIREAAADGQAFDALRETCKRLRDVATFFPNADPESN